MALVEEWLAAHLVVEDRAATVRKRTVRELYRFHHALIRAVLYDELNLRRKTRRHERVGLALETVYANHLEVHLEELAAHFAQAHSATAVEKGVDYCLRAGREARHLYAQEAAIRHLTAALELLEGLPEDEPHLRIRWEVVINLANAYSDCRAFERAQEVAQEFLTLAQRVGDPWSMAAAHCALAGVLPSSPGPAGVHHPESPLQLRKEHVEKILQIAEAHGLTDWEARARTALGSYFNYRENDHPRAEALLREALQAPEGLAREDLRATYRELIEVCAAQGKWNDVAAALRQSIPFGGPGSLAACLAIMEDALNRAGKPAEFIGFCDEIKTLYAQARLPMALHQWYLEPARPSEQFRQLLFRDEFEAPDLSSTTTTCA